VRNDGSGAAQRDAVRNRGCAGVERAANGSRVPARRSRGVDAAVPVFSNGTPGNYLSGIFPAPSLARALLKSSADTSCEAIKMNQRAFHRFGATAVALLLLRPVHAAEPGYTEAAAIRTAAEQAVREAAGNAGNVLRIDVDTIDPRLRLSYCPTALHAFVAGDGQLRDRTTVGVRCETGARWSIYLGAALSSEMPVLVARHAMASGSQPAAADFSIVTRRLPGLSSHYLSDPAQLAGQRLRRPVGMDEALNADAVAVAAVVHRGQEITLLAHGGGMDVRVTVIALSDGRPDERIRVQNPGSQRIVEATVRSSQLVEVSL
jgi:flagella basal body P-ring formation protein FlgA